MSTLAERLQAAVELEEANAAKAQAIIQGPATGPSSTVSTTNGTVKTVAKLINDADIALAAAVDDLEESATTSAAAAAASASAAAASATAAAGSATTATTQAGAASTSATNAATSASAAATSASAAAASATTAGTHATNAGNSANAAATSATNSANSASAAATSASAAAASATLASDWATNTSAAVGGGLFSAKEYASGSQASTGGSAKNWAQQTGADVTGAAALSRSAKSWAQDNLAGATYGGSAKDWAQSGLLPDGTNKSAKSYASDASASASAAATSAAQAAAIAAGLNYKGTQAGASVPATSTAAGDCYVILSAGTSQSKTWAAGDLAIYKGTSGQWDQIPSTVVLGISAIMRNPIAVSSGSLQHNNSSGRGPSSTLTNQNIGADDFSLAWWFKVPTSTAGTGGIILLGGSQSTSAVAYTFGAYFSAADNIQIIIRGANAANDTRVINYAGLVAAYGGKWVHMVLVRSAVGIQLYINAQSASLTSESAGPGVDPTWQGSITSTYFTVGYNPVGMIGAEWGPSTFYNCALSAADVLELYEAAGRVPTRFQFGSQTATYASNFSAGVDGFTGTASVRDGNIDGIGGQDDVLRIYADGTTGQHYAVRAGIVPTFGRRYRMKFDYYFPSTNTTAKRFQTYHAGPAADPATVIPVNDAWTTYKREFEESIAPGNIYLFFANNSGNSSFTGANSSTDDVIYLKNFSVVQLGAVCHLAFNEGVGRQYFDQSTNKLHATRAASGVSNTLEKDDGKYLQLALTANGELLDSGGVINIDAMLVDVVVANTTANAVSGFALAMTSGNDELTYRTDIPANAKVVLPIKRADLASLTVGTSPFGRVYYSALSWNSGSLNISIRYRRERDI